MKKDYNKMFNEIIDSLEGKPKLLLHVCCAPCYSGVFERLKDFDLTLYYYNPNTYPEEEYEVRYHEFEKFNQNKIVKEKYNHNEFLEKAIGLEQEKEGGSRCEKCIRLRIEKSFQFALDNGYDYVTTSLSVSPYKNAEFINNLGKELEEKFGVKYLFADFKKENGYLKSIQNSKEFGLYRQDYCGCEFSNRIKIF
ncbi:MAG: epoxyqueuosine reductase QueH [Clostridiales bacterium]|nr:epoxyqueuosine reductase QueH [Clostridiales bacterium]